MKRIITILSMVVLLMPPAYAVNENNDLVDMLDEYVQQKEVDSLIDLNTNFGFETFSSCEDMTTVLEEYLDNIDFGRKYAYPMPMGGMVDDVAVDAVMMERSMAEDEAADGMADNSFAPAPMDSDGADYSETNVQVAGVDEADIIKNDGDYLYYYNDMLKKIFIIASPLDRQSLTIDLNTAQIISVINVPKVFYNVELYVRGDELVIIGQRWSDQDMSRSLLDRNSRTDVVVYDISTIDDPRILKFSDLDGEYSDSRLIDDKLYVVSQLHANWGYGYWYAAGEGEEDTIALESNDLLPKTIDISYTPNSAVQNLVLAGRELPYRVSVERAPCESVYYVLPDEDTMEEMNVIPSFTVVRVIDIDDQADRIATTAALGAADTIHMTENALYLTSPYYLPYTSRCPINARCILPWFDEGQHTLIHKFAVESKGLNYSDSTLVSGMPLSQYSMSEDQQGNFRILTKTWNPQLATHFFALDENLDLAGLLLNIEPGEEFKSSRYIGDKLYLVTFEQTDPLFVIDVADITLPKIIGELKIPGFSTYLHPYAPMSNGVQYLLGLGFDTTLNQWGGVIMGGVKLDLYEIDYNQIDDNGNIYVAQKYSEIWGDEGSASEAAYNPRMFVWDAKRQLLVIPLLLQQSIGGQNCNVEYDSEGNEIGRDCWDSNKQETTFAGMKGISVDVDEGISEAFSYDYLDEILKLRDMRGEGLDMDEFYYEGDTIYSWDFIDMAFRVGYFGDSFYALNKYFAHFAIPSDVLNQVYLNFGQE